MGDKIVNNKAKNAVNIGNICKSCNEVVGDFIPMDTGHGLNLRFPIIKRYLYIVVIIASALLLAACSKGGAYILGPQIHQDVEILVEIRPGAPSVGMNEFIVVATQKNRIPAKDYIVSIKIKDFGEWRQSIQDGHSGVYRRAIRVNNPESDVLLVQLDKKGELTTLSFPLTP